MNKTIHKAITQKTFKSSVAEPQSHKTYVTQAECSDMNSYLQAASTELLQPRAEAIAQLLKKARSN